eukprot:SM000206S06252  [mRNA]  locus=s206:27153:29615:- [translate_table: standard]
MWRLRPATESDSNALEQALREREEESLADDLGRGLGGDEGGERRMPIGQRITENLDTAGLERASEDTAIAASNVGFRLLQKMGWKGRGLGRQEQGIVEPIRAGQRDAKLGVGKQEQDDFYTAEENVQRRRLDVEVEETEELARKREVDAEREAKIKEEVTEIRRAFYCELCNKQYKQATEFETHLSSYDHNHRKAAVPPAQRSALKFGFGGKPTAAKTVSGPAGKKVAAAAIKLASAFGAADSDDEAT